MKIISNFVNDLRKLHEKSQEILKKKKKLILFLEPQKFWKNIQEIK